MKLTRADRLSVTSSTNQRLFIPWQTNLNVTRDYVRRGRCGRIFPWNQVTWYILRTKIREKKSCTNTGQEINSLFAIYNARNIRLEMFTIYRTSNGTNCKCKQPKQSNQTTEIKRSCFPFRVSKIKTSPTVCASFVQNSVQARTCFWPFSHSFYLFIIYFILFLYHRYNSNNLIKVLLRTCISYVSANIFTKVFLSFPFCFPYSARLVRWETFGVSF